MKSLRRDEWAALILFLALALGAFVRFAPASLAGFPINDGGMFAVMIEDLKTSHYLLPFYTTYNSLNLPFAYPPLGFYLGRLTADLFQLSTVEVMRWLPALFASLSIPAFYLLALRLMKTRLHAATATLFFALMPRAFSWFVEGGGVTRSPAQFFMLLTLFFVLRLYAENRRPDILGAGFFGALTVMSHPEAAVHTTVSALFFWLMLGRSRRSFLNSIFVALLVLLFAAPWWVTVISRHGVAPFLAAAQTGQKLLAILHLVFFSFTEEIYATLIAVLGLLGLGFYLVKRDYLLPLWLALPFLVEGRGAAAPAAIPLALLAASALLDLILPAFRTLRGLDSASEQVSGVERSVFIYLLAYLLFSAYLFAWQVSAVTLYPPDREAMRWVQRETQPGARFLVLSGSRSPSYDAVPEWFPALAQRPSLFTVQGSEWTLGKDFGAFVDRAVAVQACVSESVECLLRLAPPSSFDYLYLSKVLRSDNFRPLGYPQTFPYFAESLRADPRFRLVYETEGVVIYQVRH